MCAVAITWPHSCGGATSGGEKYSVAPPVGSVLLPSSAFWASSRQSSQSASSSAGQTLLLGSEGRKLENWYGRKMTECTELPHQPGFATRFRTTQQTAR